MKNLNSDELRTKLAKNNGKVNKLLLQNDEIIELLRSRALAPIEHEVNHCFEGNWVPANPLTVDELKAGGWWMASANKGDARAFIETGIAVFNAHDWCGSIWQGCTLDDNGQVSRCSIQGENQIHRIGNNFYWGEPLCSN